MKAGVASKQDSQGVCGQLLLDGAGGVASAGSGSSRPPTVGIYQEETSRPPAQQSV